MTSPQNKVALIHIGNDESYGLLFVAGELLKRGFQIRWFDGDMTDVADQVVSWKPEFAFFSPMTTFFEQSIQISRSLKLRDDSIRSVFGGCHVTSVPDSINNEAVDIVVAGPVYGSIDKIVQSQGDEIIQGHPISPDEMVPERRDYYESIPRMSTRPMKIVMSHFGCAHNCSYCTTGNVKKRFGPKTYKEYWLKRRPVEHLIEEARLFLDYGTKEVSLTDDDVLRGSDSGAWIKAFVAMWMDEIGLPLNANVTPTSVLKASGETLELLSRVVVAVNMGVQTARKESLELFNRSSQTEAQIKGAFTRLEEYGISTRFDLIIGLPVDDPVGDALDTIKLAQRAGSGTYVGCSPLMLYPGTMLYDYCVDNKIPINEDCSMEWHSGIGSIKFDDQTQKALKTIKKLSSMFVKYNIDEHWMRALIKLAMTDEASKAFSECQYYDSILFRLGDEGVEDFDATLEGIELKY